jgi:hypothetical protein
MEPITGSARRPDGVEVSWGTEAKKNRSLFTYEELIGMKVSVMDLLDNPQYYAIDPGNHQIHPTHQGCCVD